MTNWINRLLLAVVILLLPVLVGCKGDSAPSTQPSPSNYASPNSEVPVSAADKTPEPTSSASIELPPLSTNPVQLTVSVMTSNRFLELAKQKFEAAYPTISIEIKEYAMSPQPIVKGGSASILIEEPNARDLEKFASSINTELMSGKAADIIVTSSHFPYEKYADKKLLVNLQQWLNSDPSFRTDMYYDNVLKAMVYKEGMYALPGNVIVDLFVGDEKALNDSIDGDTRWSWRTFMDMVKAVEQDQGRDGYSDAYALASTDVMSLLTLMVNSSFNELIDQEARSFRGEVLLDILNLIEELEQSSKLTEASIKQAKAIFQPFLAKWYADLVLMKQIDDDREGQLYSIPTQSGEAGLSFTSSLLLSISENSDHKREAWEFVKFLLSEEMQMTEDLMGLSIHTAASLKRQEEVKKIADKDSIYVKFALVLDGKRLIPKKPTQEDIDRMEKLLRAIEAHGATDPKVTSIIEEEAQLFFDGVKSADEAVRAVQNKVNTYLQE